MKKKLRILVAVILIAGAGIAFYGAKEYNRKNADTKELSAAFTFTANELYKNFEADEQAANIKLNDKVIAVSGTINKIENTDNIKKVILSVENATGGVICEFDEQHAADIATLAPGDNVKIKGVCTGVLMDVILVRCSADKKQSLY